MRDATIPEDRRTGCPPSVLSCTAWGFSCLADCSASGELLPRLFNLACTSLPKNRRCLFCDTFRNPDLGRGRPRVLRGMLPYGVRTFLSESLRSDHLPSRRSYHREEKFAAKPFDQASRVSIVTSPDQPEPEILYGTRSWHQGPRFFTRNQ